MKKLVFLSAVLFMLMGCEQKQTPSQAPAAPAAAPAAPDAGAQQPGTPSDPAKVDKK